MRRSRENTMSRKSNLSPSETDKKSIMKMLYFVLVWSALVLRVESAVPVINNLPNSTSIQEGLDTEIQLYVIDVTDDDGDSLTCDLGPGTTPGSGKTDFRMKIVSGTSNWGIYTVAGSNFDQPDYDLEVECDDGTTPVTAVFTVYVEPNQPPVINNLPDNTTLSTSQSVGYNVFTVDVTDPESDQVTLSLSCVPASCPFDIFDSGQIQLNSDISSTTVTGYDVTVTATDSEGNAGDAKTLSVILADINDVPQIQNLGTTLTVQENAAFGNVLETATCTDNDPVTFSILCAPTSGATYFQIDSSSGVISTTNSLINYETMLANGATTFSCAVTCSDGEASDTASVNFDVTDVNETPSFPQNAYTISADEGTTGTSILTSAFTIIDDDDGDTTTFTLDCGSDTGYFNIDSSTGMISYSSDYDVDGGVQPTSVTCQVNVTDSGGLSDTVSLGITINNINDNSPVFTGTPYTWFTSFGAAVGTNIGTVTASDADSGTYGDLNLNLDQSGLLEEYFGITQAGIVYVKNDITSLGSGSVNFDVIASDGAGLQTTAAAIVVISPTTTTSTTTTTDRYRTFFEDGRNLVWFVTACILLVALALVLVYMCYSYGCCCKQTAGIRRRHYPHRRQMRNWGEGHRDNLILPTKHATPIERPAPGYDGFHFWSTRH